jgi:hypothetical protein
MEEHCSSPVYLSDPFNLQRPLTLKRLLQHFAAYTKQKKSSMTYLLRLLTRHQPKPDYDSLPSTGKQLMYIDGSDVPTFPISSTTESLSQTKTPADSESVKASQPNTFPSKKRKRVKPEPLPQAVYLENGGKYMHLGLEAALAGKSPGQVFQHASLIQNIRLYTNSPAYVPKSILKQVMQCPPRTVYLPYFTSRFITPVIY